MDAQQHIALVYWHWWVIGLGLLILETVAPGTVFLWMGVSAILVGLLTAVVTLPFPVQAVIFGVLSVASFFVYRRFRGDPPPPADAPLLNRRGETYVGRVFTLAEPIVNGIGRLRVDDSQWRVAGADTPAGAQVKVTRTDGATLHVERLH
jgi:membrane protein implicated in regulation of membrane protease activity